MGFKLRVRSFLGMRGGNEGRGCRAAVSDELYSTCHATLRSLRALCTKPVFVMRSSGH